MPLATIGVPLICEVSPVANAHTSVIWWTFAGVTWVSGLWRRPGLSPGYVRQPSPPSCAETAATSTIGASALAKCLEIRQHVVHVVIGVPAELLDVRIERVVDGERDLAGQPRAIASGRVGERDRELVTVGERPGDRVAAPRCDGDLRGAALGWIQHPLQQLEPLQPIGNAGEIGGRRVARRTAAGAVEVAPAALGVAGLEIGQIDRSPRAIRAGPL